MKTKFFHFRVYSLAWTFLGEFWSSGNNGLKLQGDYRKENNQYVKRMCADNASFKKLPDERYKIGFCSCGYDRPQCLPSFCGDYLVKSAVTLPEAIKACRDHRASFLRNLRKP